jgi:hypothetical protein
MATEGEEETMLEEGGESRLEMYEREETMTVIGNGMIGIVVLALATLTLTFGFTYYGTQGSLPAGLGTQSVIYFVQSLPGGVTILGSGPLPGSPPPTFGPPVTTSGTGNPTPCPACKPQIISQLPSGAMSCASFAVIALNETGSVKDSFPLLERLRQIYPLASYATRTMAPIQEPPKDITQMRQYATNYLAQQVQILEAMVKSLNGSNLVHLPEHDLLLQCFFTGEYSWIDLLGAKQTVQFFNGQSLAQRQPGRRFSVSGVSSQVIDNMPGGVVLRMADRNTEFDVSVLLAKLQTAGFKPGVTSNTLLYFMNQLRDPASAERQARVQSALGTAGYDAAQFASSTVAYVGDSNNGNFDAADIANFQADVRQVLQAIAMAATQENPAHLIIAINIGSSPGAQRAFAASLGATFQTLALDPRVSVWGMNFAPRSGLTVPFDVFRGESPLNVAPSETLYTLGMSRDANTFQTQIGSDLFVLDALYYAANCMGTALNAGKPISDTPTSHTYRVLPGTNTIVAEELQDCGVVSASAGAITDANGEIRRNGLWAGAKTAI